MTVRLSIIFAVVLMASCSTKKLPTETTKLVFSNPILSGFNPDPSICSVGEDYYLVNSSFAYFPGIPILHSKDLVHWEQIGSAIDRTEQMDLSKQGFSRGLFAPAISYHEGWFYIVCTLVDDGGNFVVRSEKPEGPYSKPIWIPELDGGIDPSLFFDKNGKVYVVYNHVAPENKPLYSGHRTIRLRELDKTTFKPIGGESILVNGGVDISKNPVWIEGPHIYQKDSTYYLMCAEGGTSTGHSEVLFKSNSLTSDFVPYDKNPILTQRHLDKNRPNPITSTGHADIVELPSGEWWAVFLGCRPYEGGHFNTGRETFLAPVRWENDWFTINPDYEEIQYEYSFPETGSTFTTSVPLGGKFTHRIDFSEPLDKRWLYLRNVKENWLDLDTSEGTLTLPLRPETIDKTGNPTLLCRRQTHLVGEVNTYFEFVPANDHEMAGLVILQNASHYYFINKTADKLQLLKKTEAGYETLAETPYEEKGVYLKVESKGSFYDIAFSSDGNKYTFLKQHVDATYLSTETAGGFIGVMYGLFATANGQTSTNEIVFDYFEYKNL